MKTYAVSLGNFWSHSNRLMNQAKKPPEVSPEPLGAQVKGFWGKYRTSSEANRSTSSEDL